MQLCITIDTKSKIALLFLDMFSSGTTSTALGPMVTLLYITFLQSVLTMESDVMLVPLRRQPTVATASTMPTMSKTKSTNLVVRTNNMVSYYPTFT